MILSKSFQRQNKRGGDSELTIEVDYNRTTKEWALLNVVAYSGKNIIDLTNLVFMELHDEFESIINRIDWEKEAKDIENIPLENFVN